MLAIQSTTIQASQIIREKKDEELSQIAKELAEAYKAKEELKAQQSVGSSSSKEVQSKTDEKIKKRKKKTPAKPSQAPKRKYAPRTLKIPQCYNTKPDNLERHPPKFMPYEVDGKTIVTAGEVLSLHKQYTDNIASDRAFVYALMRLVFSSKELEKRSLTGRKVPNKSRNIRVLDRLKVDYVYQQYQIRGRAVGINPEERRLRSQSDFFRKYITGLTRSVHTYAKQQEKQRKMLRKRQTVLSSSSSSSSEASEDEEIESCATGDIGKKSKATNGSGKESDNSGSSGNDSDGSQKSVISGSSVEDKEPTKQNSSVSEESDSD